MLSYLLVLVDAQEGFILEHNLRTELWSILLIDHTGGIFTCDGCVRDPYFVARRLVETQNLSEFGLLISMMHIAYDADALELPKRANAPINNSLCSEKYSFGPTSTRVDEILINRQKC